MKHKFEGKDLYNVNKTSCTAVQVLTAVVTTKGKKQVCAVTSGKRGEFVTVMYVVSAIGNVIPPLFFFPRVNFRDYFIKEESIRLIGRERRTSWINEKVFVVYIFSISHSLFDWEQNSSVVGQPWITHFAGCNGLCQRKWNGLADYSSAFIS